MKLIYQVVRDLLAWTRLSRRAAAAKNVEIFMGRHHWPSLSAALPRTVHRKLSWADRAWLSLLAQLLPRHHLARLRLIVTPGALIRWHRDLLRRR